MIIQLMLHKLRDLTAHNHNGRTPHNNKQLVYDLASAFSRGPEHFKRYLKGLPSKQRKKVLGNLVEDLALITAAR